MKSFFTFFILFIAVGTVTAQPCTPDPQYTNSGVYPAPAQVLNTSMKLNDPFEQVLTINTPSDTTVPILGTIQVDSFVVSTIDNLPPGLQYECNPTNCVYPGGSSGCFTISGTPTALGQYQTTMTIDIFYGGGVGSFPLTENYTMEVKEEVGLDDAIALLRNVQLYPNPASSEVQLQVPNGLSGEVEIEIINILGTTVSRENIIANGSAVHTLEISELNQGNYFVRLVTNGATRTLKLAVVQ